MRLGEINFAKYHATGKEACNEDVNFELIVICLVVLSYDVEGLQPVGLCELLGRVDAAFGDASKR